MDIGLGDWGVELTVSLLGDDFAIDLDDLGHGAAIIGDWVLLGP